jgi:SHS2 domain-containing protein
LIWESDMWEHFAHQADIGIRGIGPTIEEAFAQAGLALMAVIGSPDKVNPRMQTAINCQADDAERLFLDWINALIFEVSVRHGFFCRFEVAIRDGTLTATAFGEPIDPERHETAVEPKAATYLMLDVRQRPDGNWIAQCVVDV